MIPRVSSPPSDYNLSRLNLFILYVSDSNRLKQKRQSPLDVTIFTYCLLRSPSCDSDHLEFGRTRSPHLAHAETMT